MPGQQQARGISVQAQPMRGVAPKPMTRIFHPEDLISSIADNQFQALRQQLFNEVGNPIISGLQGVKKGPKAALQAQCGVDIKKTFSAAVIRDYPNVAALKRDVRVYFQSQLGLKLLKIELLKKADKADVKDLRSQVDKMKKGVADGVEARKEIRELRSLLDAFIASKKQFKAKHNGMARRGEGEGGEGEELKVEEGDGDGETEAEDFLWKDEAEVEVKEEEM